MSIAGQISLLQKFPVVSTRNPEEMAHTLKTVYGAVRFDLITKTNFEARANFVQLPTVSLGFCAYGSEVAVDFPEAEYARQQISLRGTALTSIGGKAVETDGGKSCITSPGQSATLVFGEGYEQLVLRISKQGMIQKHSWCGAGRSASVRGNVSAGVARYTKPAERRVLSGAATGLHLGGIVASCAARARTGRCGRVPLREPPHIQSFARTRGQGCRSVDGPAG